MQKTKIATHVYFSTRRTLFSAAFFPRVGVFLVWLTIYSCMNPLPGQPLPVAPKEQGRIIAAQDLQKDLEILKTALTALHPGLYRYADSVTVEGYFQELAQDLSGQQSQKQAYLAVSRFLARLRCGHTYANFYNQSGELKESAFDLPDKVPFTFHLLGKRMFIDKNVSQSDMLSKGSEVLSINGVAVSQVIDSLLPYVKGDGGNMGQRLSALQVSGVGRYEAFDILYPLLFPPANNSLFIETKNPLTGQVSAVQVSSMSRSKRMERMEERYGKQLQTYDSQWTFRFLTEKTAYLKLGTFVTNKMTLNWKSFLKDAFRQIEDRQVSSLVIDIRDNEGGEDEVNLELARYLASKPVYYPEYKELLVYERVPASIRDFLHTWDKSFYNRTGKLNKTEDRYYTPKKGLSRQQIPAFKGAYAGKIYLLINAANSSATFMLAKALKDNSLATLAGEQTGGNEKGITAGQLFFLHLPHSKVEVDIPLIGYYPLSPKPDSGIIPDIPVHPTAEDYVHGRDKVLEVVLEDISR